jgi:UDP-N-acetylmuramoyl-tripeptide--D-alanyl-D-alanine ligase
MRFRLHYQHKTYLAFVPGYGEHQVSNALATLATINELGFDLKEAIARLATYQNMARHLEFSRGPRGSTIIDDTWTNNPTSVEAALKVLDSIGKGKKVILILGDIKRLGAYEKKYHREIGTMVADRKIHTLVTIGRKADEIARQALIEGSFATMHRFNDLDAEHVRQLLEPHLDKETIVLIKGPMSSRAMIALAKQLKE